MEEVIKELKKNPGFSAYVIMNNDGIVIKYESMGYQQAVHHAALVLDLAAKSKTYMRELFEPPDVSLSLSLSEAGQLPLRFETAQINWRLHMTQDYAVFRALTAEGYSYML